MDYRKARLVRAIKNFEIIRAAIRDMKSQLLAAQADLEVAWVSLESARGTETIVAHTAEDLMSIEEVES